ncbi:MAG: hypothetical protein ABI746_11250 [Dermatophilaceae bacterium]
MESASLAFAARQTYRYLRVGIVVLTAVLGASVVGVVASEGWVWRGSISAYFYSPARSVFVGALMAIGICLVALQGRLHLEEELLNLAGLLMPFVALVPAPYAATTCGAARTCVPEDLVAGVVNNVWAFAVGAMGAIVVAAVVAARDGRLRGAVRWALLVQAGVVVTMVAGLQLDRVRFLAIAHYATATPLFLAMVAVVWVNGRATNRRLRLGDRSVGYGRMYGPIALGMLLVIAVAGVLAAWEFFIGGRVLSGRWLFWVETLVLGGFAAFWVVQTAEFWQETVPEDLTCPSLIPRRPR